MIYELIPTLNDEILTNQFSTGHPLIIRMSEYEKLPHIFLIQEMKIFIQLFDKRFNLKTIKPYSIPNPGNSTFFGFY